MIPHQKNKNNKYSLLLLFLVAASGLFAQSPSFISYQGAARNAAGTPVASSSIAISFEIRQGSASSSPVFTETQVLETNALGLFSTKIGTTNPTSFNAINWQGGSLFLQIGVDVNLQDGISYTDIGVQDVASVPYAMHAQSVPSGFTNNILSIGNATYALLTPQTLTAGTGIAINSGSIVNTSPNQTVNLNAGTNILITGTYPDYTITANPTLSYNNNDLSISGGNTVTIAPSLSINGNTLTVGPATNTLSLPVAATPSISGAGIATVSPASGYNFTVSVAQPTFAYSSATGSLTSGTSSAYITPTLGLNGNTLNVGPATNSLALPVAATPTINGAGIATVSPNSGYNFTVDVTPASFVNTGQNIITGTYPNYSVNTPTFAATDIVLTATAAAGPSLTTTGTNSFALNIPPSQGWNVTGNAGTTAGTNFIGTTDNVPLIFKVNSIHSGAIDQTRNNAYFGQLSGSSTTTGSLNAGFGQEALQSVTSSNRNSGFGYQALKFTTGSSNTGIGASALANNTTGNDNTALGKDALYQNTSGSFNLAAGTGALLTHVTGDNNVALGRDAHNGNSSGANNVVVGSLAGYSNNGSGNVFIGYNAAYNETGSNKFYLANTSTTATPLLYGDFTNNYLGIGTTTANAPLQFNNNITQRKIVLWEGANNDHQFYGLGLNVNALRYQVDASVADHVFYSGINSTSSLELMRIKGTGNVGIGTSSPSATLHVAGTTRLVDGTEGLGKVLTSDASGNASWVTPAAGWGLTGSAGTNTTSNYIGTSDANGLLVKTNATQRMMITSTGEIGFGSGYTPGAPIVMQAQGANIGILKLYNSNASGGDQTFIGFNVSSGYDNSDIARIGSIRSGGGGEGRLFFTTGGFNTQVERMRIDEFGRVGIGTTAPTATFQVAGTTRLVDGTQGAGKVLVSDALGNASWQTPASGWNITGNAGTTAGTNFIGTTDAIGLRFKVNNVLSGSIDPTVPNAFFGYASGSGVTTGSLNAGFGHLALGALSTGIMNSAVGYRALGANNTGNGNSALGSDALLSTTSGIFNVGIGLNAGRNNTTGGQNVALGKDALMNNATGSGNIAIGYQAGFNAAGSSNVFVGNSAGSAETGSNKLYIANSGGTPLIYGDFANGKVGINTTTLSAVLTVENASLTTRDGIHVHNGRDEVGFGMPMTIDAVTSGQTYGSNTYGRILRLNNATQSLFYDFGIGSGGNFFLAQGNNYSPAVFNVSNSGRIGIRTAAPSFLFEVSPGTTTINNAQGHSTFYHASGNGGAIMAESNSTGVSGGILPYANAFLAGYQGNSPVGSNVGVWGNATGNGADGWGVVATHGIIGSADKYAALAGPSYAGIFMNGAVGINITNPTFDLQLGNNSAAKPGTNTWSIASDRRLKTNIHNYDEGLKELLKINPVWYTYTGEAGMPKETYVGVIAQDLQEIAPHMVKEWTYTEPSANTPASSNETASPRTKGRSATYLSVDNGAMTYMMINAIKEQQKQIEDLKKTVEEQSKQIDALLKK